MHKSVSSAPRVVARTSLSNSFVLFSFFFCYIRHSSQKEVKGCEWRSCRSLLLDLIFHFYFRQWRAKSCRFHLECGRLESLVKETECLILSPQLGPRGVNDWPLWLWASERELQRRITVPTRLWNLVDFFLSVLSSMEKSGSGFRALGSAGGQWTSIKPTREAVMRRADWRAWTLRATWLTGLANLFFFLQSRPHIPPWKRPISTPSWMQSFKNPSVHKKKPKT